MENVDETIDAICVWIQSELKGMGSMTMNTILPETIKALADLVAARAQRN